MRNLFRLLLSIALISIAVSADASCWNGSGTCVRSSGVYTGSNVWQNTRDAGRQIRADDMDTHDQSLADGITNSIAKDGQNTPTANLPMGGFHHTGVGNSTARTNYATVGQVQDGDYFELGSVSGTNTVTASASPTITAYAQGQTFRFIAAGTNTGGVTLNINSLGAKAVQKLQGALASGDIHSGDAVEVYYDGTHFQMLSPTPAASLVKTGVDTDVVSGTAGTDGNLLKWNSDGDAVDSTFSVIDEDSFATNSATKVPTQQSTKAYVDAKKVQIAKSIDGAVATGTTTMPFDDSIPQNTEGTQFLSVSITPKSATSTLDIVVTAYLASHIAGAFNMVGALFQDSTAGALAAVAAQGNNQDFLLPLVLHYAMTSGTTSSTTFKFRAGTNAAGTTTMNGQNGGRLLGGVFASSIIVTEIAP